MNGWIQNPLFPNSPPRELSAPVTLILPQAVGPERRCENGRLDLFWGWASLGKTDGDLLGAESFIEEGLSLTAPPPPPKVAS